MAKNSNCNSYISDEDLVLAKNNYITYTSTGCCGDNDVLSDDVYMPFGFWVTTQYGNASRHHRFTANAPGAHVNGGDGKYTISVNGSEIVTLHLYDDVTHDEIYTKTGKSFEATDIPELIYNRDYSFIFTKGMDSSDLFEVRIDYRTQTVVDSNEQDCYNCDCNNCDYDVPVQGIAMRYSSYSMKVNDTVYLQYNIIPSNAANKSVTWHSSNSSVAKVDASTGKITAKSAGTAKITATSVDGGFTACCKITVDYCGGSDYKNVTNHNMVLENDGYYVCSICGYRAKSPELEDSEILSTDDYLKVIVAMHYYSQCELLSRKELKLSNYYKMQTEFAEKFINAIRAQEKYTSKYVYSDSNGVCYGCETNNNLISLMNVIDINFLNIGVYNGLYESICNEVIGYYCPQISTYIDILKIISSQMTALDFGAFVAGMYEDYSDTAARYAKGLSIASAAYGVLTSEIKLDDKVIEVHLDPRIEGKYIIDKDNKIKEIRLFLLEI